jgi:hypothetical protein
MTPFATYTMYMKLLSAFGLLLTFFFVFGSMAYFLLLLVQELPLGSFYKMFLYHYQHPYQYIFIASLVFAILASAWGYYFNATSGCKRYVGIGIVLCFTIPLASILSGTLWKIHDMQAGWFTDGVTFYTDLIWGATAGLKYGWMIVLLSTPYNIIMFIIGMMTTTKITRYIFSTR